MKIDFQLNSTIFPIHLYRTENAESELRTLFSQSREIVVQKIELEKKATASLEAHYSIFFIKLFNGKGLLKNYAIKISIV